MLNQSVKSITIIDQHGESSCNYYAEHQYKLILEQKPTSVRFSLKIAFTNKIISVRNSFYEWETLSGRKFCDQFSPKVIYLENELYVQPNINLGFWEINADSPNELIWCFNSEYSAPLLNYSNTEKIKSILDTTPKHLGNIEIALLSSHAKGIEISRSKVPFSAIACFSDHCDFDTEPSLKIQREFFNKLNIKITKGFFLYHYSKREETACWENNKDEYIKWLKDGHELAYHSLSQSVKPYSESIKDFMTFMPPLENIVTWIDHGFQPYNLAQINNSEIRFSEYNKVLEKNNIKFLWNYLDCGFATTGVINQLNANHFTLEKYWKGIKQVPLKHRIRLMLKTIFTNYYSDPESKKLYGLTAKYFRVFLKKRTKKSVKTLVKNTVIISGKLLKLLSSWDTNKRKQFNLAKNTPLVFKYNIGKGSYNIFQTIEMVDFKRALSKSTIELLVREKGVFIAHTYFSVPHTYHNGRFFKTPNKIDKEVYENFSYLGLKIKSREIWNPTVKELIEYLNQYQETEFDCNDSGEMYLIKNNNIISRDIHI